MLTVPEDGVILTEGSVFELLRRDPGVELDPAIAHAALIYDPAGRSHLAEVHAAYLAIGQHYEIPLIAWSDTWRASGERIGRSRFAGLDVNGENVRFMRELAAGRPGIIIGALTGPKGDAYDPREAPTFGEALRYHARQIAALADAKPDLIVAATLPAFDEARAIARLLGETRLPYMVSAVVRAGGTMLDGTPLESAIRALDAGATPPLGFSINCAHASIARAALQTLTPGTRRRVIALQANTSRRAPEELDGLDHLETEDPETFAEELHGLARETSLRIVGGCCGTDARHIEALAARLGAARDRAGAGV